MEPDTIERLPEILRAYLSEQLPQVRNVSIHNVARSPGGNSRSMWFFDADWEGEAPVAKQLMFRANESTCFRDEEASLEKEWPAAEELTAENARLRAAVDAIVEAFPAEREGAAEDLWREILGYVARQTERDGKLIEINPG